ncbi:MAG: STAS domain-containing protein [Deltaproteobacteria bacterium]|nr:STAS domain-containing protein [Deltaproteobacteria bacterium]
MQPIMDVSGSIADILLTLADVGAGDYAVRLSTDLPESDPFGALRVAINEMVASLAEERERARAYQAELEDKLATIELQREAIRDLSTPIMEVWDGVLCLPVVGVMDSHRSAEMTEELLKAIVAKEAECAIIDITGIEVMDTRTADHFLRMAKSVRLLGAHCFLTGLSPAIAQTVVHIGVDLQGVQTHRSLRDGLRFWVARRHARKERTDRP